MNREELLRDLRFLEELGLVELDVDDDGQPHWSPTEKGRALGEAEERAREPREVAE